MTTGLRKTQKALSQGFVLTETKEGSSGIATENALLAITSLGLDGAWLAVAPIRERMEIADAVLGIGSDLHAFAPVPFGYPGENRKQEDRFHAERVHYL